ncbi:MAG: transglycosylase SLT domain-containing protein [Fimbriimonadaceae bacterium]|nr:transglycosylase SLT domain-containing protein [Fimbriimonadaceae bacterium]
MIPDGLGDLFARVNQIQGLLDQLNPEVAPTQSQSPTSTGSFQQALQAVLQPADPAQLNPTSNLPASAPSALAAAAGLPLTLPTTAPPAEPLATPRTAAGSGFEVGLPSAAVAREVLQQDRAVPAAGTASSASSRSVGSSSKAPNVPAAYRRLVKEACQKYGVDESLVLAVMQTESDFNPRCVSSAGAMGLLQLMPENCRELGVSDPFDPAQNIDGGVRELKKMLATFDGDLKLALAGYNAGPNAVKRYGGVPPYRETQDYIPKVLRRQAAFQEELPALTAPSAVVQPSATPPLAAPTRSSSATSTPAATPVAPLPVGPRLTTRPTKGESAASIERALQAAAAAPTPLPTDDELPASEAPTQPAVTVTRRSSAAPRPEQPAAAAAPAELPPIAPSSVASVPAPAAPEPAPAPTASPAPVADSATPSMAAPPPAAPAPPANPPAPTPAVASAPAGVARRLPTSNPRHLLGPREAPGPSPEVSPRPAEPAPQPVVRPAAVTPPAATLVAPAADPAAPALAPAPVAEPPLPALGEALDNPAPRRLAPRSALPGVAEVVTQSVQAVAEPLVEGVRSLTAALSEPPLEQPVAPEPPAAERRLPAEPAAPRQERDNPSSSSTLAAVTPGATAAVAGSETPTPDREQRPPRPTARVESVSRSDEATDPAPVFSLGETARTAATRPTERPSGPLVADNPREVTQQIAGQARLLRSPGSDQFTVEVRHPEAGQVAIRVLRDASGVHVTMQTSHEGLRREMQQQLPQLQEALREHGLALGSFDVGRRDQQQPQPQQQPLPQYATARDDAAAADPDPQPVRLARTSTPTGGGTLAEWA